MAKSNTGDDAPDLKIVPTTDDQEQEQEGQDDGDQEQEGQEDDGSWHVVQPSDSWEAIAEAHSTRVEKLHALNAHTPHFSERSVQVGTRVRVR